MKYLNKIREALSGEDFPTFKIKDLKILLASYGANGGYAYTLLHNMASKGEIRRITRGIYTFHDDVRVAGFAFAPFYYGLEDALAIKGFWEQGANPVIITPRKTRTGPRVFNGRNYMVHRIDKKHFFGFELLKYGGFWIPVSDNEKTLIDFLYFRHYLRADVLHELRKASDPRKIKGYLKMYDARFSQKVLGMLEAHGK